jgi:anti-sigma regulatory factor (Ser/Thr protein kinase)
VLTLTLTLTVEGVPSLYPFVWQPRHAGYRPHMGFGDDLGAGAFSHAALVYERDQQLLDAAVPFLREGVAGGETTVLSVGSRERPLILDALGDASGVTVVPPWPPEAAFRTLRQNHQLINGESGHDGGQVRILGAVPGTDDAVPWAGWVRYETAINRVYLGLPVSMLCPYDRRITPRRVLEDVKHTHPLLTDASDGATTNSRFVEPRAFLDDLAARDLDPIESQPPTLELVDQLPGTSRRSVSSIAEKTDLDRPAIEALALAVGEVATNAVVHGRPPIVLRAWARPDRVVVSILDHGSGPADPFVGMLPVDTAPSGGLGLHVAYQTCSLVTMSRTDSSFTVHLTMRRS